MKNLIIYVSDAKDFNEESHNLIKIQIENSLRLGWTSDDFLLVTNFPYEYMGIKATITEKARCCTVRPRSTNTTVIPALIEEGIIEPGHIYWDHDTDAFQVNPITDEELQLDGYTTGLTDYGWKSRLCMGSFFVKAESKEFYEKVVPIVLTDIEDEDAVKMVMDADPELAKQAKMMNVTYNIGQRKVEENLVRADHNPKVFHFHPSKRDLIKTFAPLMPPEMAAIFAKHGHS